MESVTRLIDRFVDSGTIANDGEIRRLLRELGRSSSKVEHDHLDFKREFDESAESWIDFVKHIVALANAGGGVLLLGLSDGGARVGLAMSLRKSFDATNIAAKISKYGGSATVRVSYSEISYYSKSIGLLWVYPSTRLIVFDKTVHYPGTDKFAIQQGVVYVRRQTATGPATQLEVNAILDRLLTRNLKAFIARIDHVASLPASTQLVATSPGSDSGYILTASKEGIPVTIVGPEKGATAIKIDETLLPEFPLSGPTHEIANQVRQWRMDSGHRVQPGTLHRWYRDRDQIDFDAVPDGALFACLSAIDGSDFPMFWASKTETEKLRGLLEEKIASNDYPANDVVPYIVGAFFWDERKNMLPAGYGRSGVRERVRESSSRESYLKDVRRAYAVVRLPDGREARIKDTVEDRPLAAALYEEILCGDDHVIKTCRNFLHQLDLLLHAEPK